MARTSRLARLLAVVAGGLFLAACGSGGGGGGGAYKEPTGPAQQTIKIEAGNFYFKPDQVTAKPGIASLQLDDAGGLHTLVFDHGKFPGFQLEVGGDTQQDSKKIQLTRGKYTFYCDIPGHRAQGMEGTLTVT